MLNPKKWPRKYQWLLLFFVFFLILLLSPSRSHATEPPHHKDNQGHELVKGAAIEGLAATVNFIGAGTL